MESADINGYRAQLLRMLRLEREFVAAEGDWLHDSQGNAIYDALSQYGTHIFGHNDAELAAKAAQCLTSRNTNFIQPHYSAATRELAQTIKSAIGLPLEHVCFTNSGAESVEAAIKLARIKTGKVKVISLRNGFHGKTFSALSACGSKRYKMTGIYDAVNFVAVDSGDLSDLRRVLDAGEVAAFIFEPVQGEGGMAEVDPAYLHSAIDMCHAHGVVVIADEIQCGLGRCGAMAYSAAKGYRIDVLLLGKGLGGGIVPIGLVLYGRKVYAKNFEKAHSSTFAGGGFACTVALAVLDRLQRDRSIFDSVERLSALVDKQVAELQAEFGDRVEFSGVGLMRGISLSQDIGAGNYFSVYAHNSGIASYLICSYLLHKFSILTMPLMSRPCAVRFEPALNTDPTQVVRFFAAIREVATLLANGRYDVLVAHLIDADGDALLAKAKYIPIENTDLPILEPIRRSSTDYRDFDFAFLIHATAESDFIRYLPRAMRLMFTPDQQQRVADLLMQAGAFDSSADVMWAFRIDNGRASRKGLLISCPMTPQALMRLSPREKLQVMDEYFARAMELGVKIVGLGAYTSVITRGGLDIVDRYPGVCITTGNSLTAISVHEQFKSVYRHRADAITTIIGARGSVGRAVTLLLLSDVPKVVLVGKSNTSIPSYREFLVELIEYARSYNGPMRSDSVVARIKRVVERLLANESDVATTAIVNLVCAEELSASAPIIVSANVVDCLRRSDYVLSSTSEGKPFLDDKNLKDGAVALDAGRPFDFNVSQNAKARVYEAGLVIQPHRKLYGDCNLMMGGPGTHLACLSETIVLSMENASRHYSIGRSLDLDDMAKIKAMALRNHFLPFAIEHYPVELLPPLDEDNSVDEPLADGSAFSGLQAQHRSLPLAEAE